ncbi:hypothetical protein MMC21_006146 [Puttea exsequens]|nr:hypothetical protein [Puttea exsequens]
MEDIFGYTAENLKNQYKPEREADRRFLLDLLCLRPDGCWKSQNFRQGLQTLLSFPLIRHEGSQRQFSMHRLAHLWAYDRLAAAEKNHYGNQAQDILRKSISWRGETSYFTLRRDLLPHITSFQRQTNSSSANFKGDEVADFALAFFEAGRWKQAEELEIRVMGVKKRVLGKEHPDILRFMNNLASTYSNQGRWKEAEGLGLRLIEVEKKVVCEEHPDTLTSVSILATIYWDQGR